MQTIIIHTDGGARGNPGPAGVGVVILNDEGKVIKTASGYIGERTNNYAEYEAVVTALETLKKTIPKEKRKAVTLSFHLDSELVVKQLSGVYQIKEETLFPQFVKIWNFKVSEFPNMSFTHVPREKNKEADMLVNQAIDGATKNLL